MGTLKGLAGEADIRVTAYLPNEKRPGYSTGVSFICRYKKLKESEFKDLMVQIEDDDNVGDDFIIDNYFIRWDKLPGDGGHVEFNDENLAEAREHTDYRSAIVRGFVELHRNTRSSRQGN